MKKKCTSIIDLIILIKMKKVIFLSGLVLAGLNVTTASQSHAEAWNEDKVKADYQRPDEVPFPEENMYTLEKEHLGKILFFDPRLSGSNFISCATCHNPGLGWGDGMAVGTGDGMKKLGRHTPTVLNSAFGEIFMWDGRAEDLETQALGPIGADVEMNQSLDDLEKELAAIKGYRYLFTMAFPDDKDPIKKENIAKAIATYERTIISGIAPFDKWVAGEEDAISKEAQLGFKLFNTKAKCSTCHSGWNFTDDSFHDIGLKSTDIGRGKIANIASLNHAFKTPGLRDIVQRAPYMHDGSLATLKDVVNHYNTGGIKRETLSSDMEPLNLSTKEVSALVAFMKTLTGDNEPTSIPVLPR